MLSSVKFADDKVLTFVFTFYFRRLLKTHLSDRGCVA